MNLATSATSFSVEFSKDYSYITVVYKNTIVYKTNDQFLHNNKYICMAIYLNYICQAFIFIIYFVTLQVCLHYFLPFLLLC